MHLIHLLKDLDCFHWKMNIFPVYCLATKENPPFIFEKNLEEVFFPFLNPCRGLKPAALYPNPVRHFFPVLNPA